MTCLKTVTYSLNRFDLNRKILKFKMTRLSKWYWQNLNIIIILSRNYKFFKWKKRFNFLFHLFEIPFDINTHRHSVWGRWCGCSNRWHIGTLCLWRTQAGTSESSFLGWRSKRFLLFETLGRRSLLTTRYLDKRL